MSLASTAHIPAPSHPQAGFHCVVVAGLKLEHLLPLPLSARITGRHVVSRLDLLFTFTYLVWSLPSDTEMNTQNH